MKLAVPFFAVGVACRELEAELDEAISRVAKSGWYLWGPEPGAFELEYAEYVGVKRCIDVGAACSVRKASHE